MSGFHGMYSFGGIIGAGAMTVLLSVDLSVFAGTLLVTLAVIVLAFISYPGLLTYANPIGAGCANIVPVMFSAVGRQKVMSQLVAVPAVTTMGYLGVLSGPAVIGYVAHYRSLSFSFSLIMALMLIVAVLSLTLNLNSEASKAEKT